MRIKLLTIPALQVEYPAHDVRVWQTGMTRSPAFARIKAPWSHNLSVGRTGWHSLMSRQWYSPNHEHIATVLNSHPVRRNRKNCKRNGYIPGNMAHSLSFIPYSSCTMFRHRPRGRPLSKAVSSASALFHFCRRAGQVMR